MLVTISDLLQQIMDKQKFFLDSQKITHPGTIGDMFEGLSKTLLDKALFKGLNLNIRDGFIRDKKGNLSKQIDCMIIGKRKINLRIQSSKVKVNIFLQKTS